MGVENNVLRTIPFDGKQSSWHMWSTRFLAKIELQEWDKVLLGTEKVPADDTKVNADPAKEKANEVLRDINRKMYTEMLLSCMEEVCFECVASAKTNDLKKGDASLAWTNLKKRFESTSEASKVQLKRRFANCKLKQGQDPELWIMELERIRRKLASDFKNKMSDEDMLIHVMNNLSSEYDDMIDFFELQMTATQDKLTLEKIKDQLRS